MLRTGVSRTAGGRGEARDGGGGPAPERAPAQSRASARTKARTGRRTAAVQASAAGAPTARTPTARTPTARTPTARTPAVRTAARAAVAATAATALAVALAGCGGGSGTAREAGGKGGDGGRHGAAQRDARHKADPTRIPGVGDAMHKRIPGEARQVVAVYGEGADSASSTVRLFTRKGEKWTRERSWQAHNGRKGWTPDHHEGDKRSPVGVFSLTDAGGVRPAPDAKLPYTASADFTPPSYWPVKTRHDFDHVIAVDYNRHKGTSPLDPTRPEGESKGGSIWLHLDHGSGTSGCVSLPREGMRYLLRTLDPERHPAVVMGDRAALAR